jgi:hypothetical protein
MTNEDMIREAGLRWQLVEGEQDLTGSPTAERDASEARLWTEDGAVLVGFWRPSADLEWTASRSDCLSPAAMCRVPHLVELGDLDIGAVLDLETEFTDLPDSRLWLDA